MAGEPGTEDGSADAEKLDWLKDPRAMAWFEENLPQLRRSASGHGILYRTLAVGFVVGLAAHVGGYALRSSEPGEPLALLADLLYALGWALWTGVVVVLLLQVFPETKRRQLKQAVDAYEAMRHEGEPPEGTGGHDRRPTARGE
jgi:hypothetical protein